MKLLDILNESKGIPHIEDLAIKQFIDSLRNFDKFEISEKVDGSSIHFGIDQNGFYTSREHMGGKRIYNVNEYDIDFHTTFQRAAHVALERILPTLIRFGLSNGDRVEVEVLFGVIPNIIRYNDEVNEIIFLRVIEGDVDINHLKQAVLDNVVEIQLETPFTLDGKTIETENKSYQFAFKKVPTIDSNSFSKSEAYQLINDELDELEAFLYEPSGVADFTNIEVLSLPLNRRPENVLPGDWKEVKELLKSKRDTLRQDMYHFDPDTNAHTGFKYNIKEILLNKLVRTVGSQFGPDVIDGGWIEGVVFRDTETGFQFKVVDKDLFTMAKDFLWKVRQDLTAKPVTVNAVNSFVGSLLSGLATSVNHPELATTQAKRYLRRYGDSSEEILAIMPLNFNINVVRSYWISFLDQKENELETILANYNSEKEGKVLDVDLDGFKKSFSYNTEIDSRTLQSFSKVFKDINEFKIKAKEATRPQDFILALVGHQLSTI